MIVIKGDYNSPNQVDTIERLPGQTVIILDKEDKTHLLLALIALSKSDGLGKLLEGRTVISRVNFIDKLVANLE